MGVAEPMQIYALRYAPVNTAGARHLPATKDASLAAFRKGIVHLSTLLLGPICYSFGLLGSGHQFAKKKLAARSVNRNSTRGEQEDHTELTNRPACE